MKVVFTWLELSLILGVVCVIAVFFSWQLLSDKLRVMDARIAYGFAANLAVNIGVVGPSWRQTKLVIRRIGDFARRLPAGSKIIVQKTRITCANGSVIEAFPNNPDTIRGPTLHVVYC